MSYTAKIKGQAGFVQCAKGSYKVLSWRKVRQENKTEEQAEARRGGERVGTGVRSATEILRGVLIIIRPEHRGEHGARKIIRAYGRKPCWLGGPEIPKPSGIVASIAIKWKSFLRKKQNLGVKRNKN